MKNHRLARVSEAIREVASEAILFELRDPRIKFTTVTRAEVSADLQKAKVYVSVMGSEKDCKTTLTGLNNAAGFVQSRLADRMKTRFIPVLEFILDEGMKNSMEVSRLLSLEKPHGEGEIPPEEEDEIDEDDDEGDAEDDEEGDDTEDDDENEEAVDSTKPVK
ncbi:30S ribosome-binding factor RbfA [Zavarzinella formosa]|uniref:30S ribosome-binding factor RbfA n=1 Tax=Zavarzinella formosa TaxID=360055 RepID=UPI0002D3DA4C|nr:30S ribosome-binding factor RbfA [Zavarzinella formosa]